MTPEDTITKQDVREGNTPNPDTRRSAKDMYHRVDKMTGELLSISKRYETGGPCLKKADEHIVDAYDKLCEVAEHLAAAVNWEDPGPDELMQVEDDAKADAAEYRRSE